MLVALVVLAALASVFWGSKTIEPGTVLDAVFDPNLRLDDHSIIRDMRMPRTVLGLMVGAALGLAGAVMQGVTRNPLADPGLLGVNAGAALAVVAGIYFFDVPAVTGSVWFALVGAAGAGVVVYAIGSLGRGGATPVKLTIAGAAVAALLASLTSTMLLLDSSTLDEYRFWAVGSLVNRDLDVARSVAPFMAVGALLAVGSSRALNGLALGDDVARGLGQRVGLVRAVAATSVVLLCGAATAGAGPVWFVGLIVPHVARSLLGPDHRWLLPCSMLLGAAFLTAADTLGRLLVRPGELEVGIVTAFVGGPVFIAFVRRHRIAEL